MTTPDRIREAIGVIVDGLQDQQKEPNAEELGQFRKMFRCVFYAQQWIEQGNEAGAKRMLSWLDEDAPEVEEVRV